MIRNLVNRRLLFAVLVSLGGADAALADTTYTISGDFGSSVFKYGQGTGGSSFTQQNAHSACDPQLDCYLTGGQGGIVKNISATDGTFSTFHSPAGTVSFHPSAGSGNTDAIIRFVAPIASIWQVSGQYWRNDITNFGNGTQLSIFKNVGNIATLISSSMIDSNSYGQYSNIASFGIVMNAGDSIDFALNNIGGDHYFDSTGIEASFYTRDTVPPLNTVPEPASWAMLIAGFGVVGAAARRQRAVRFVPA